jgi:hypothetical protein
MKDLVMKHKYQTATLSKDFEVKIECKPFVYIEELESAEHYYLKQALAILLLFACILGLFLDLAWMTS